MIRHFRRVAFFYLMIVVAVSAVTMTGCSLSKGTDMAERKEIFKMMQAEGFVFSWRNLSTAYGENNNQITVTGRMAQRTPDNSVVANGAKLTQYTTVVVENVNGKWTIKSKIKYEEGK